MKEECSTAEVLRCDAGGVDIKFHRCPLREAWQEAGLSDEDTAKICAIAARVDNGTFEGPALSFSPTPGSRSRGIVVSSISVREEKRQKRSAVGSGMNKNYPKK